MAALTILILPGRWWLGAILAVTVHEFAHLIMLWLLGGQVLQLRIGAMGARIEMVAIGRGREALCAFAGPLGSLMLALITSRFMPEAALCALVQGLFNLLPVYPLDGGRILRCLASRAVCASLETFTVMVLFGGGLWLSATNNLGLYPMIPGCIAIIQRIPRKIPCKEPELAVQ